MWSRPRRVCIGGRGPNMIIDLASSRNFISLLFLDLFLWVIVANLWHSVSHTAHHCSRGSNSWRSDFNPLVLIFTRRNERWRYYSCPPPPLFFFFFFTIVLRNNLFIPFIIWNFWFLVAFSVYQIKGSYLLCYNVTYMCSSTTYTYIVGLGEDITHGFEV